MPKSPTQPLSTLLDGKNVLLVGCGKMGSALLQGWLSAGLEAEQFYVQDPQPHEALSTLGVNLNANSDALREAAPAIIVLAVKPQLVVEALPPIALLAAPETLVISLMAGVSINTMSELLGGDASFVRTMPNNLCAP